MGRMSKNRYIGEYPVIGIRPVIDARRGELKVRESLEEQTMGMAKAASELLEQNIRYSNGEFVKVVIANTTIGRVAEAAACAAQFQKEGVAITLTVTPCWCYGAETMDMEPTTIKGVWGFNGTERPGAVYLASVLATHAQKGLPAFGIYGHDVQEADEKEIPEDVKEKLLRFARAAVAVATIRGKSYLQIGSVCMGIGGSIMDPAFLEEYLGMRVESVDEVEIIRRVTQEIYDKEEYKKALEWTRAYCKEGLDKNPEELQKSQEEKDADWEFTVKRGQTIGIIGGTGSGKSTIVNMIPRFYDATSGKVLIDGIDVKEYTIKELRQKIGMVLQKAVLFKGSIRENLKWGKEDATEEELMRALEISQAKEFVDTKEGGLDYRIEQGGKNLSGGQKQRLTIARAVVRDPEILILDDSASALDFATDAKLRQAIRGMKDKLTVFIVSQRASSIQYADQIIVMDDGKMVGIGKHNELLASCEVYKEIYDSQFRKEGEK